MRDQHSGLQDHAQFHGNGISVHLNGNCAVLNLFAPHNLRKIVHQRAVAEAEKNKLALTAAMETELSLEGIIKSMGFDDVVISASSDYYNIMVKAKELTTEEVAKILDAVTTQTGTTANYVRIIPVE